MASAARREHKIVVQQLRRNVDGYGDEASGSVWADHVTTLSAIYWGSGSEQRKAAQEGGVQAASFEILATAKARQITVEFRLCYPVSDPNPAKWPVWDITAVAPANGRNDVRITASRAA